MTTTQMPTGPLVGPQFILETPWRNFLSPLTAISWDTTSLSVTLGNTTVLTLGAVPNAGPNYGHVFDLGSNSFGGLVVQNSYSGATGPSITLFQDSPSPAASDFLAYYYAYGRDSAANAQEYGYIGWDIVSPTNGSEASRCKISTIIAGAIADVLTLNAGVTVGAATGGDQGAGTVNATGLYLNSHSLQIATTVANLPSAATVGAGFRAFVTDATATTFHSTVAGGGANKVPVVSDGTNWLIG